MSKRPPQVDPYTHIPCALLNSGDLHAYATHGAKDKRLFEPFVPENVKSASYEINWHGTAYWWPDGLSSTTPRCKVLAGDEPLEIPRNGIVFIQPQVVFNVPDYLALRFNLHIRLVHRGLLLGTGPLVDPGFVGRLLIPVHNLTDNRLVVNAKDGFIWVEVTKVSPITNENVEHFKPFPEDKKDLSAQAYFHRASRGEPIRSSIPSIALAVSKAETTLERYERRAFWTSAVTIFGVIVGVAALAWSTFGIWRDTFDFVNEARAGIVPTIAKEVVDKTTDLRARIDALERDIAALQRERNSK